MGIAPLAGPLAPHGTARFGAPFAVVAAAAAASAMLALTLDGDRPARRRRPALAAATAR